MAYKDNPYAMMRLPQRDSLAAKVLNINTGRRAPDSICREVMAAIESIIAA
jgi:hypothetical protein